MPAIWNVGSTNGYSDKKLSSKLTFEEGETFKGRIVAKGDGDAIIVKISDGWQFPAELLEDSNFEGQQLVQFKVEGFEDGKIKLKVINDLNKTQGDIENDIIKDFINKEGISKKDFDILKSMVKFGIPLTKENIDFVKSVFMFSERIDNKAEINEFINNYISGKGIDLNSKDAALIKNTITEFFNAFKTMTQDDLLLFLENDIDINKENIDSYNKIFKGDMNLKNYMDNLSKDFAKLNLEKNESFFNKPINEEIHAKNIQEEDQSIKYSQKQNIGLRIYDESSSPKSRISLLNLLKTIADTEKNLTKDVVRNVLMENKNIFKGSELKEAFTKLDNMKETDIYNRIKETTENSGLTKEALGKSLSNIFGKEIHISNSDVNKFKEIFEFKLNNNEISSKENNTSNSEMLKNGDLTKDTDNSIFKSDLNDSNASKVSEDTKQNVAKLGVKLTSTEVIKQDIHGKIESMKDVIKEIMSHSEDLKSKSLEGKVAEFIKSNINDFKLFNSISDEYYYLNVPINKNSQEYPCKLIIKDDRKENKKIDSSNVKIVVAVKTINLGTVDGYLTVKGNNLNVNIKCIDRFVKILDKGKNQLAKKINELGYVVNISVTEKVNEVSLTSCREFFNDGNTLAIDRKV